MIEKYTNRPALRVIFKPVTERKYVRSMSLIDPSDDTFKISLDKNTLTVPRIPLDVPTVFNRFTSKDERGRKFTVADGYKIMVTADETYRMGHLVKIERSFGVYIKNENNEQHTKPVTIFTQSIYLRYLFGKDERRWKIVFDGTEPEEDQDGAKERLKRWLEDEEMLDGLLKTPEIDAINEAFENVLETDLTTHDGGYYADTLTYCSETIDAVERYFGILNEFELIKPIHHTHITGEIEKCRKRERQAAKFLSDHPDYEKRLPDLSFQDHGTQQLHIEGNRKMDGLREQIQTMIVSRGYWVNPDAGETYENPAEHTALKLPANDHRNRESKTILKQTLLAFAANHGKDYVELTDPNFTNMLEKNKKSAQK